jgi:SAM-dependent methyltransferase
VPDGVSQEDEMAPDETQATAAPLATQVMQMIWAFMVSHALHIAAKLAVFDVLRDGAKTAGEVAEATGSHEPSLRRLLRLLTSVDVLAEDERGRFSPTPLGDFLRSDHPQSARALAVMYGEPFVWKAWGDLYQTIKTGRPGFDQAHGESFFDYLGRHPADAAVFNAAMTSATSVDVPNILGAYDFSGFAKIVDVAGGHGALLRAILERCPKAKGVLCDLPSVVAGASAIKGSSVEARCELVGADMFQSVPAGGDAYVLKRIIHDWSDAEAARILQSCRRAIAPGGKLLVIDAVVKPPNQPDPAKLMDLNMLVLLTGRERTDDEFRDLYALAGFELTRIVPTPRVSIVEGVPA